MLLKEFRQLSRDRLTFAIILILPLLQLTLFGYAINTNPKNLPTIVLASDNSPFTRALISGMKNSSYFRISQSRYTEEQSKQLLATGKTKFVVSIPANFTRQLLRNERPQILIEADATDPIATRSAMHAIEQLSRITFSHLFAKNLQYLQTPPSPIDIVPHAIYNPENITHYNIVPGLLGVVITMTMVMITSMAITREREQGTMENLLATPIRPIEVILGKIAPYIIVGYMEMFLILMAARFIFHIPIQGNVMLLIISALPFIAANLSVGLTFSSRATNQLQAVQMSTFFFLPTILLSGFAFPFYGMPTWAQYIGEMLPITHFLRITRGIILKGNTFDQIWPEIWPIVAFMIVITLIGLKRYRKTLN